MSKFTVTCCKAVVFPGYVVFPSDHEPDNHDVAVILQ